jgi:hypothetical protein
MKRTFAALVMTFGLGSLFLATPASAQDNPAVADVPFSFVVSGKTLPAGQYNIAQIGMGASTFRLQDKRGESILTKVGTPETGNPLQPSVTFRRAGGEWVLVRITPPDSLNAYSFESKQSKQSMRLAAMVSINLK